MRTTWSTYLECYLSLLQIRFLKYAIVCQPLATKGLFQEDLMRVHLRRTSSDHFKSRNMVVILGESSTWIVVLETSWFHVGEIVIHEVSDCPLLLLWTQSHGKLFSLQGYSPVQVVRVNTAHDWSCQKLIQHRFVQSKTSHSTLEKS